MTTRLLRRGGMLGAVLAATLLAGAAPASAAPGDGSAYGAKVNVQLLGAPAVAAGPFAAASTNGPTSNTFAAVTVPGVLSTGVLTTSATRDDTSGAVMSRASTADVGVPLLKSALGSVTASAIEADCSATQKGITTSSKLVDAKFGSLGTLPVDPAPNTKLDVALPVVGNVASVTLNEQYANADGSRTVNAVHVRLLGTGAVGSLGSGDVIISSATCGPAGLPTPMASGAGMWIGFGLLAAIAAPIGVRITRRRATD